MQREIKIKFTDDVLRGVYANLMQITHTREEFVLDFANVFPPGGIVTSRVIVSPGHLKRIVKALSENMKKYEGKFGPVEEAKGPGEIGFKA